MRTVVYGIIVLAGLGACNTVQGIGQDIQASGQAIQGVAVETERVLQPPLPQQTTIYVQ